MRKPITIYVDMDDVLADFSTRHAERIKANPKIQYPQAEYGFFANLDPIPNAITGYDFLHKNFIVHILTAPSVHNPMCYTEKRVWVEKHLGIEAAERMIISGYKNLLKGDYLIDDNVSGKAQDLFNGELIHFGKNGVDWSYVVSTLANKYIHNK